MKSRMSKIQVCCPAKIKLINTDQPESSEAELHKKYAIKHIHGGWFALARRISVIRARFDFL